MQDLGSLKCSWEQALASYWSKNRVYFTGETTTQEGVFLQVSKLVVLLQTKEKSI